MKNNIKKIQDINIDELELCKIHIRSDYVLYYDNSNTLGFEAHFDNNEFNDKIACCLQLDTLTGIDITEEWFIMNKEKNKKLYNFIKNRAIKDYHKGGFTMTKKCEICGKKTKLEIESSKEISGDTCNGCDKWVCQDCIDHYHSHKTINGKWFENMCIECSKTLRKMGVLEIGQYDFVKLWTSDDICTKGFVFEVDAPDRYFVALYDMDAQFGLWEFDEERLETMTEEEIERFLEDVKYTQKDCPYFIITLNDIPELSKYHIKESSYVKHIRKRTEKKIGKIKNKQKIKEISSIKAHEIINKRKPKGLFYTKSKSGYTGIDNISGNAWTEDFEHLDKCKRWLRGEFEMV